MKPSVIRFPPSRAGNPPFSYAGPAFFAALTTRRLWNNTRTMKEDRLEAFKQVIRRRIDMRRIVAVCVGDEELARSMVVRGLREIADEIERGGGKPRVRWDEERKIPLMNTD